MLSGFVRFVFVWVWVLVVWVCFLICDLLVQWFTCLFWFNCVGDYLIGLLIALLLPFVGLYELGCVVWFWVVWFAILLVCPFTYCYFVCNVEGLVDSVGFWVFICLFWGLGVLNVWWYFIGICALLIS